MLQKCFSVGFRAFGPARANVAPDRGSGENP